MSVSNDSDSRSEDTLAGCAAAGMAAASPPPPPASKVERTLRSSNSAGRAELWSNSIRGWRGGGLGLSGTSVAFVAPYATSVTLVGWDGAVPTGVDDRAQGGESSATGPPGSPSP